MGSAGTFRLFQVRGITVFLHWSWFLVAVIEIQQRSRQYTSLLWNVLEYLVLFGLVLAHEFGHVLACRQVGGQADRILLWPLGGVAIVNPPPRPGATLWSIAAGPLVNVVLIPVFFVLGLWLRSADLHHIWPNVYALLRAVAWINLMLLVFNLLPVYPLDGGQILRSLLWYPFGRATSLLVATIIGFVGVLGVVVLAVLMQSIWTGVVAVFILLSCWGGLQQALALARMAKLPRRAGFACPDCGTRPPVGAGWVCDKCHTQFDTFETRAMCPSCGQVFGATRCVDCGRSHSLAEWTVAPPSLPGQVRG